MNARELLIDTTPSIAPARALEALSTEQAEHRQGTLHTIAEIVSHLAFWQDWFRSRCEGGAEPMPASAALGWQAPAPGAWPEVRQRFLDGLEAIVALGEREEAARVLAPPLEFPPLAGYTVGDVLYPGYMNVSTPILYYNAEIFEAAGVNQAEAFDNWESFAAACLTAASRWRPRVASTF